MNTALAVLTVLCFYSWSLIIMDLYLYDLAELMQWTDVDEEKQFMATLSGTLRWEVRPRPILTLLKVNE